MPPGSPLHPVLLAILTHAIDKSLSHELHYTQARGLVESWLSSVEASMRATLRAEARRCMREYAGLPGVALSSGGTSWAQLVWPLQLAAVLCRERVSVKTPAQPAAEAA